MYTITGVGHSMNESHFPITKSLLKGKREIFTLYPDPQSSLAPSVAKSRWALTTLSATVQSDGDLIFWGAKCGTGETASNTDLVTEWIWEHARCTLESQACSFGTGLSHWSRLRRRDASGAGPFALTLALCLWISHQIADMSHGLNNLKIFFIQVFFSLVYFSLL